MRNADRERSKGTPNKAANVVWRTVRRAVKAAWKDLSAELPHTPLSHWNESVFRFFVTRSLLRQRPTPRCHTEWNRIDLAVQVSAAVALVEFKFFRAELLFDIFGQKVRRKGGPSKKNFTEFCDCVEKLVSIDGEPWTTRTHATIAGKFIVLSYIDRADLVGANSFLHWYEPLRLRDDCPWADRLKVLETLPAIKCPQSQTTLICKLFSVQ